jgi:rhamnogalacturonan endolyase
MTVRGYMQSHLTDFYLGDGMSTPPTPNIYYTDKLIDAEVKVHPGTLNLKSKGRFITATIELSSEDISLVDAASIRMNVNDKTIFAQSTPVETGDHDGDGTEDLMVKFDRQKVISAVDELKGNVDFSISGYLQDGSTFIGKERVKVKH